MYKLNGNQEDLGYHIIWFSLSYSLFACSYQPAIQKCFFSQQISHTNHHRPENESVNRLYFVSLFTGLMLSALLVEWARILTEERGHARSPRLPGSRSTSCQHAGPGHSSFIWIIKIF